MEHLELRGGRGKISSDEERNDLKEFPRDNFYFFDIM